MKNLMKYMVMLLAAVSFVACSSSRKAASSTGSSHKIVRLDQGSGNGSTSGTTTTTKSDSGSNSSKGEVLTGKASYYADKYHGRKTASGELYDKNAYTCAHRTLKFGTMLKVTNKANGKSVKVKVNDRGPFVAGRIVDLSGAAADAVDMKKAGVIDVEAEILK